MVCLYENFGIADVVEMYKYDISTTTSIRSFEIYAQE